MSTTIRHPHEFAVGSIAYVIRDATNNDMPPMRVKVSAYGWCDNARTEPAYMTQVGPVAGWQLGTAADVRDIG